MCEVHKNIKSTKYRKLKKLYNDVITTTNCIILSKMSYIYSIYVYIKYCPKVIAFQRLFEAGEERPLKNGAVCCAVELKS